MYSFIFLYFFQIKRTYTATYDPTFDNYLENGIETTNTSSSIPFINEDIYDLIKADYLQDFTNDLAYNEKALNTIVPDTETFKEPKEQHLEFDINNVFVETIVELSAFISLYRTSLLIIAQKAINKKKKVALPLNQHRFLFKQESLAHLISKGLDFFEKNNDCHYTKTLANRLVSAKKRRNYMILNKKLTRDAFKSCKRTVAYEKATLGVTKDLGCSDNKSKSPLFDFSQCFSKFFHNITNKTVYNRVFLTLLSLFYKVNTYFNNHLTTHFKKLLVNICPDDKNLKRCYCLSNKKLLSNPYCISFWISDWGYYIFSLYNNEISSPLFSNYITPQSIITRIMIIIFCAFHHSQIDETIVYHNIFMENWATNFSDLLCEETSRSLYFENMILDLINCCYSFLPLPRFRSWGANILDFTTHTAYIDTKKNIIALYSYVHDLIYEAFIITKNNLNNRVKK